MSLSASKLKSKGNDALNFAKEESGKVVQLAMEILKVFILVVVIVLVYSHNTFLCRVAQAHMLPNAMDAIPFTRNKFMLYPNPIYCDLGYDEGNKYWSQEIYFPENENMIITLQSYLGKLYDFVYDKNTNFTKLYIGNMLQNMFVMNFFILTIIYNFLNRYVPDFMLLLFGIFILKMILMICFVCNTMMMTFLWGYNISVFFYDAKYSDDSLSEVEWIAKSVTFSACLLLLMDPLTLAEVLGIISLYFSIGWWLIIPLVSMVITLYSSIIFPHFLSCRKKTTENESYTALNIFREFFQYRSSVVLIIICFYLSCRIYCYFGYLEAIYWMVAVLIMYFFTEMFENKKVNPSEPSMKLIEGAYVPVQTTKKIIPERVDSFQAEVRKLIHLASGDFQLPQGFNKPEDETTTTSSSSNSFLTPPPSTNQQVSNPSKDETKEEEKNDDETKEEEKKDETKEEEKKDETKEEEKKDEEKKDETKEEEKKDEPKAEEKKDEPKMDKEKYIGTIEDTMQKVKKDLETITTTIAEMKK
jgi:hypothetical protein